MPETSRFSKSVPLARSGPLSRISVNPYQIALSIVLGTFIWLYIDSRQTIEIVFEARLEINVPEGWEADDNVPEKVIIRVRGSRQSMSSLKEDEVYLVETISAPVESGEQEYPVSMNFSADDVRGLPPEVSVTVLDPLQVSTRIVQLVKKYVGVEVQTSGEPEKGYMVALKQVEPWYVEVEVPQGLLSDEDKIKTERIDLTGRSNGFSSWVRLEPLTRSGKTISVPRQVYASVEIIEAPVTRELEELTPVRIVAAPDEKIANLEIVPAAVRVTVEGFIDNVTKLNASEISVYVDSREKVPAGKGRYVVRCRSLPLERARVIKIDPPEVQWVVSSLAKEIKSSPPGSESKAAPPPSRPAANKETP